MANVLNKGLEKERARRRNYMRRRLADHSAHEKCVDCGKVRLVNRRLPEGPVCTLCYKRRLAPRALCVVCGEEHPLARRVPPTCYPCYYKARKLAIKQRKQRE